MNKEQIDELSTLFSNALKEYILLNGTKGLCWFCKEQYKLVCSNYCEESKSCQN